MDSNCQGLVVRHRLFWPLEWSLWITCFSHGGHKILNTAEWDNNLLVFGGDAVCTEFGDIIIDLVETPLNAIDLLAAF